ncbi:MAG: FtsX-like permease family protein [Rhodanobacter sp.]
MEIRPIFASLRKHRIPAILIVLEIALACAVLCNAVFMIGQRVVDIHRSNAIDERGIAVITVDGADPKMASSDIPRNLARLRAIAGVQAVAAANTVPLSNNNWGWAFGTNPDTRFNDAVNVSAYFLGEGGDKAFGLQLLQGRFFNSEEYADSKRGSTPLVDTHVVIVTQSVAERMWPGQPALGKVLYSKPLAYTVVGVVADVLRPFVNSQRAWNSIFFPLSPDSALSYYVVRSAPQDRDRIVLQAQQALSELDPIAVVKGHSFSNIRDQYFANMSSMAWMLVLVCVVMLAVTAFGIVGLTSFWVQQRRRQIGIRRAIGATRGHIMQYFQTENFLLSSVGILLGIVLAFAINLYLMRHYEMTRMPWFYLPGGAIALWLLGQLAVLGPARRAARVPPVVATRSV